MDKDAGEAAGRYAKLATARLPYLNRARACAELTIPSLLPPEGATGSTDLPQPYQSAGARGVNNLASKLLLALLPPNQSFFRMSLSDAEVEELAGSEELRTEVETALAAYEKNAMTAMEAAAVRPAFFEVFKNLIVAGNVLILIMPGGKVRVYKLGSYVVKRSPNGDLLEVILHEKVSPAALTKQLRALVSEKLKENWRGDTDDTLDLYTWATRDGPKWRIKQELAGKVVPKSAGTFPLDKFPILALRWTRVDGEDYGRGLCEEYFGDLRGAEVMHKAILEASAAMAKMLFFVDPTGTTTLRTVAEAPNLAVRPGRAADVTVLQANKAADLQTGAATLQGIERRLAQAFLQTSSVQRNAERVTAEEIRLLAGELEDALGGVYALLSQELQLPYIKVLTGLLQEEGKLPRLPPSVQPTIVTGLEALGRSHEVNRILTFGRVMRELLGDRGVDVMEVDKVGQKVATAIGIPADLVKTAAKLAAEREESNRQAMVQRLGPEVIRNQAVQQQQQQEAVSAPQEE